MAKYDWFFRGYVDARDGKPYVRSPEPNPPMLPDSHLPREWTLYFEGWNSGIQDNVRDIPRAR